MDSNNENWVMTPPVNAKVNGKDISEWVYHALNGHLISAIKALRKQEDMSLVAAKRIVESVLIR